MFILIVLVICSNKYLRGVENKATCSMSTQTRFVFKPTTINIKVSKKQAIESLLS